MKKILILALVAIMVIAIGGYFYPQVQQRFGATSTLDGVDNPFVTINGHQWWIGTVPMVATSSVPCSVKNYLGATSTIEHVSIRINGRGTLTQANNLVISTSTTEFATSSPNLVHDQAIGTGLIEIALQKNTATTTSTAAGVASGVLPGAQSSGATNYILRPSERINFAISTSTLGGAGTFTSYPTGYCSVELKAI